ncbi:MAG: type VI secretion system accessory protein TagJ [Planctomycetota bacterium]
MIDDIVQLFNQGELTQAIEQGNQAVAKNPRDLELRLVLIQLVCFTGDWERVEKIVRQLQVLDSANEHMALTNFVNQLSIAEIQRAAVWNDGMVPEFVETPDDVTKKLLWAWNCARKGDADQFRESIDWVLEQTPELKLELGGQSHGGFRDLDDRTCTIFEAHTLHGVYLWIPHAIVDSIDIAKPTRLIDHIWSHARVKLKNGTDLTVYLPGLYFHSLGPDQPESIKLGRTTEWTDVDGFEQGAGRRIFGAGDDEFTLFDFSEAKLNV